jgi:hypothetical protein
MPKTKSKVEEVKEEEKIIDPDLILGDELIPGEVEEIDEEEDGVALDDEEVDPFKDKWEE